MSKEVATKISQFVKFHEEAAFVTKQLDALKKWFKADAGDEDTTYEGKDGTQIHVIWGETTRYDNAKLDAYLADEAADYKTTTSSQKVSITKPRKTKKA